MAVSDTRDQSPGGRRPARRAARQPRDRAIIWIAVFRLAKGALLIAVAIGALKLLHHDVGDTLTQVVRSLRADPDNRFIHKGLAKLGRLDDRRLEEISAGSFIYAALLLTEGTGLLLGKRWAEYFTVILTASLLPLEVYELFEKFTATRAIVIVINAAIVVYLVARLRHHHGRPR